MTSSGKQDAQHDRFKALARELGCDEDEAAFDRALSKVAKSDPIPKHVPKKRKKEEKPSGAD